MRTMNSLPFCLGLSLLALACADKGIINTPEDPVDADGDGFSEEVDCDDDDPDVYPGAEEVCDGIDNNCSESIDEGLTSTAWPDSDGDGYGDPDGEELSCPGLEGWVDNFGDCDDTNSEANPGASEICDDVDNNCDGVIDENLTGLLYPDVDGDGYGDTDYGEEVCLDRSGWVEDGTDCDDDDDDIYPDAVEVCDGEDNDCDGLIDLDDPNYEGSLDCDGEPAPPGSDYSGWETFEYSAGSSFGARDCELYWDAEGEPWDDVGGCVGCEFVFDIDMSFDSAASTDNGTCASLMVDSSYTYGYTDDYNGYGAYLMYYSSYYGTFQAWGNASLVGATLEYSYGYEDWDYYGTGTYYTYIWAGEAELD
jgi:hypothetical protein